MPEFIINALLAGIGVAVIAGPLGSFTVWRRMAYFGDTLAHSALLGVAFGVILSINLNVAVVIGCLLLSLMLVLLQQNRFIATDTLLGILSHSTLALGLVGVSLFNDGQIDLMSFLLGDLLSASLNDVLTIYAVATLVMGLLFKFWHRLLAITVHEELAFVEGVPVKAVQTLLMLMMALVIAIAMKVVGVLLITALLIIPAAAARRLARTPEQMACIASLLGCLSVVGGLAASYFWDTPAGPSVVLTATCFFILALMKPQQA